MIGGPLHDYVDVIRETLMQRIRAELSDSFYGLQDFLIRHALKRAGVDIGVTARLFSASCCLWKMLCW